MATSGGIKGSSHDHSIPYLLALDGLPIFAISQSLVVQEGAASADL